MTAAQSIISESKVEMQGLDIHVDDQGETKTQSDDESKKMANAEIDTSAPFDSVKEAVTRFGGIGYWKPPPVSENDLDTMDISKLEAQAVQLEKDLILKESETSHLLKDLENAKTMVENLKAKIQNEASEVNAALLPNLQDRDVNCDLVAELENQENVAVNYQQSVGKSGSCPSSNPGSILMELKQAKLNLTRTTHDLADIRATVEEYNMMIEKERNLLEKTRQRLSSSTSNLSSLDKKIKQTNENLQLVKDAKDANAKGSSDHTMDIARELHRLNSETEQFKKISEAAKSEVSRAICEIEQTNSAIKTAEIRLIAAKTMKEAAKATEAFALAEIKALSNSQTSSDVCQDNAGRITLSLDEYYSLTSRALRAEELCKNKEMDALLVVDEANLSQTEILKRVEAVTEEVKISKDVLQEALNRVEAANKGKMAVEEALRKWRSKHIKKRRSTHKSTTKFKNSHQQKSSHVLDVNGPNIMNNDSKPVLRPTLSIGQILSRKLLLSEEYEHGARADHGLAKRTVSLGQMLGKTISDNVPSIAEKSETRGDHKLLPAKRKKFGFSRISLLVTKQSKRRQTSSSRVTLCRSVDVN